MVTTHQNSRIDGKVQELKQCITNGARKSKAAKDINQMIKIPIKTKTRKNSVNKALVGKNNKKLTSMWSWKIWSGKR